MSTESSRRVLITGASGLLGRAMTRNFRAASWEVIGLAKSRVKIDLVKVNLLDFDELRRVVLKFKPNAIIHSAAERDCNKVDNDYAAAYKLNVEVSQLIAELAAEIGAVHVYISTDYVFDGKNAPYKETDEPNPLNKYGITKLEGERVTLKVNPSACILRVPLLYGQVEYLQESVVSGLLLNLLDTKKPCNISDYEIRYPTHVDDIAEVCRRLVDAALKNNTDVNGIYQSSGREPMTKFKMMSIIARELNLPMDHIVADPNPTQGPPRPYNSKMDTSRLDALIGEPYTKYEDSIKKCLLPFLKKSI